MHPPLSPLATSTPHASLAARRLQWLSASSLAALVLLCLAWELWWAPLRPGGSWLALKAAPLMLPLSGLLAGRRYTFQWSSMFILLYFMEGIVRATSDTGPSRWLAAAEAALAAIFFFAVITYARITRGARAAH